LKLQMGVRQYEIDDFVCTGSDKKGHSSVVSIRIPPEIEGRVSALLAERVFPYSTFSDFVRDAVYHRLDDLAVMKPQLKGSIHPIILLQNLRDQETEKGVWLETVERIGQRIKNMTIWEAKTFLGDQLEQMQKAPDTKARDWAIQELNKIAEKIPV